MLERLASLPWWSWCLAVGLASMAVMVVSAIEAVSDPFPDPNGSDPD